MPNKVQFNQSYPDIAESDRLYRRALQLIPSVTQTLAKGPTQYIKGVAPKYLVCGKGSRVWDVDGNEYVDYSMAVGPSRSATVMTRLILLSWSNCTAVLLSR